MFYNDVVNCVREHLDKWYATSNHQETAIQLVDEYEERIRADERAKTIEEMAQTIRKIEADTTHCLFDCPRADEPITCTICTLEKAIKQMKGAEMKVGDIIINPYVEKEFNGKPNPIYKSMVIHKDSRYTTTLRFDGETSRYWTRDCKEWEIAGHIDLEEIILKEQK